MSGQPGDLLDADPAMAHQAHERGPQLAWRPAIADPGRLAYALEHLPDIRRVEGGTAIELYIAAPDGLTGSVVVDVGLVEV